MEKKKRDIVLFAINKLRINERIISFLNNRFINYEIKIFDMTDKYSNAIVDEVKKQVLKGFKRIIVFLPGDFKRIERNIIDVFGNSKTSKLNIIFKFYEIDFYDVFDVIEEQFREELDVHYNDLPPEEIQAKSFNIIEEVLLGLDSFKKRTEEERRVIIRVVHSLGDFSIVKMLSFSKFAIEKGKEALRKGNPIVTDVKMVEAGISRLYKKKTFCMISSKRAKRRALMSNITRAAASFELLRKKMDNGIVVVGNAPTALVHFIRMQKKYSITPALVIGVPVGFVGAAESKEILMRSGNEYITVKGIRGGSTVASAIINAIGSL